MCKEAGSVLKGMRINIEMVTYFRDRKKNAILEIGRIKSLY